MIYFAQLRRQKSLLSKHALLLVRGLSAKQAAHPSALTSCSELHARMQEEKWHENLRILDARWDLDDRDYRQMHMHNRIPCSKFFSFEECRDVNSPYPVMLPTLNQFERYVSDIGISNSHHVVVYDDHEQLGLYTSPRVWWMFRTFGHEKVSVLDGGLRKWISDGLPTVSGNYTDNEKLPATEKYKGEFQPHFVQDFDTMLKNITSREPFPVVDTRGSDMGFDDQHIKNSFSAPFVQMLNADRTLRTADEILDVVKEQGIDVNKQFTASCCVGVTATILTHALYYAIGKEVPVYDGSVMEFEGRAPDMVVKNKN